MNFLVWALLVLATAVAVESVTWSQDELDIVGEKLRYSMGSKRGKVLKELETKHKWVSNLSKATRPNAPKILRLGFHDCVPYDENVEGGAANGCDGCLNPSGMATDLLKTFGEKGEKKGPEITFTDNNGLMHTAQLLEEIYTNPDFPKGTSSLGGESLQHRGKSRADLWAYATLVAAWYGISNNNKLCDGDTDGLNECGNLRSGESDCKIQYKRPFVFKTGRQDCIPDMNAFASGLQGQAAAYFTSKHEVHPNAHANGPWTVNYYKQNFNMSAREAIALTGGAHSFGKFNSANSYFRYSWTRKQEGVLNNQLFRHYSEKDQYFLECKNNKMVLYGDAYGNKAKTSWQINLGKHSKSGGPFQWFHRYDRCPASGSCGAIDMEDSRDMHIRRKRAEPKTPANCCKNLGADLKCQPECQRRIQNDETALPCEVGFYRHFKFDETTGMPYGCDAFDTEKFQAGKLNSVQVDCGLEEHIPEGETQMLYQIVEEFAEDQEAWMDEFVTALEKMLDNGYGDKLTPTNTFLSSLEV